MEVIDERDFSALEIPEDDIPVRAVHYVEVGEMTPAQIAILMKQLNESFKSAKGGTHYVVPIRNGKIGSDIVFENEWLEVVRNTCEIVDNQILLKNNIQEVKILRQRV